MQKPVPYEHRGQMYRKWIVLSDADAAHLAREFRLERDIWLRKLLAAKLIEANQTYRSGIPDSELREALECRVI